MFGPQQALLLGIAIQQVSRSVRWRTNTAHGRSIVFVPAVFRENVTWISYSSPTFSAPNNFSFVLYQRIDPTDAFYSPNKGDEAGIYLQYIVEHYDSLPDWSIFVQARPWEHHLDLQELADKVSGLRTDRQFQKLNVLTVRHGVYAMISILSA